MILTRRLLVVVACLAVVAALGALLEIRAGVTTTATPSKGEVATKPPHPFSIVSDDRRQQLVGVRTARVVAGTLAPTFRTVGVITYDETRLTDVNLKVDGWIRDLHVNSTGQRVQRDQPLLTLYSPTLISVQIQLLAALRSREALPSLGPSQPEYAERLVETPRERLVRWDVPPDQLQILETTREVLQAVVFRSPVTGVVIEKAALKGMHVDPGETLYKVADPSVVWIDMDLHEPVASQVRVGTPTAITLDAWPGRTMSGQIANVYPFALAQSRTVKARIEVANPDGRLKPGLFANVEVMLPSQNGLLVPEDAVVDSGRQQRVFVSRGDGHFDPRTVTAGARADGKILVLAGLHAGEVVATRATFFLDSESNIQSAVENYDGPQNPATEPMGTDRDGITMELTASPARTGESELTAHAEDRAGQPITDVDIRVLLNMPPMPTMNMPGMRAEARLDHMGDGLYRGTVTIPMSGRWDATVTALRKGQEIATRRTSLMIP